MNKKNGFSLIEIVATLVILGITLVAIISLFSYGTRTMSLNKQRVIAYMLLQRKFEELKSDTFNNVNAESGILYSTFPDYSFDVAVQPAYGGNPYLKKVDISISWTNNFGGTSTNTIATFIADHF